MTTNSRWLWIWLVLALVQACGGPVVPVGTATTGGVAQGPASKEPLVLVVTLQGKLGTQELARCTRTLREAEGHGVKYVVFYLDQDTGSLGEDPEDLQSLFDRVQDSVVPTVALVRGHATLGAAYLALCTDKTYCLRGATIGVITKPEPEWSELLGPSPDEAMVLRLDAVREALSMRLERRENKLRPDAVKLALAMADPRMQLVTATVREGGIERRRILDTAEITALQGAGTAVLDSQPLPRPLVVDAAQAEEAGLSLGTVEGLEHLCTDVLLVERGAMGELAVNWAEQMVGWLEMLSPFLLIGGFLLILFEVKTPGFGLPGLLGAAFLGLAMFHSYLVGLAEVTEILVFFLGLAALAVEIFLLPGTVIFGAVGFLCLVLSLVLSRQSFVLPSNTIEEDILLQNLVHLTLLFVLVLGLGAVMWRLLPHVPFMNRVFLRPPLPGGAMAAAGGGGTASGLGLHDKVLTALVGRTGKAATVLRPAGVMDLDGERIDVVTEGEFLEPGTTVRVLYVQGNRVVVAAEATAPGARAAERGSVGVVLLLAIVGLCLLVAEVFFVSFGVIAICAGLALISAVFVAFQESTAFGVTMLVSEAIAAPVVLGLAFKLLPHTRFGKELILSGPTIDGSAAAADPSLLPLLHKTGVTLSPLRPAGFARIDGHKVDVVTRGEMLAAQQSIKVVEVAGNRVVVAASSPAITGSSVPRS